MRNLTRFVLLAVLLAGAAPAAAESEAPAQVMLLGVFHFENPGLDVVRTDQVDVTTAANQAYLESLANRISQFDPTIVLLEFSPEREPEVQEEFERYVRGDFTLSANEIHQLGFRIAARSSAATIHGFDETGVQWQAEPLFSYLESNDAETGARMTALIQDITREEEQAQRTLSLRALIQRANDPQRDALNRYFYLSTNHVGDRDDFVGADASASWWHRNFRMYALVQRHATRGERVLVIGGQGHIAILRPLLADDRDREAVDITEYLR